MELTKEQKIVMDGILKWFKDARCQHLTGSGNAGTGKSFLLSHLPPLLPATVRVTYCTFTGKASSVLLDKLKQAGVRDVNVSTIHKLIYKPKLTKDSEGFEYIDGWERNDEIPFDLIVIDEASMVGEELFRDLMEYDLPILAVGDDGQLGPVSGDGFCLMNAPDLTLRKVHRQAQGNPIIQISQYIRENGILPRNLNTKFTKELKWYNRGDREFFNKIPFLNKGIVTLSGLNKTRGYLNHHIRGLCGYSDAGVINPGERVVCLKNGDILYKNNVHDIMNGMIGTVDGVHKMPSKTLNRIYVDFDIYKSSIPCVSDIRTFGELDSRVLNKISGDPKNKDYAKAHHMKNICLFDYGYNLTVHKSQGSEWPCVILVNERNGYMSDDEYTRWLYTGITRASERLFIINGYS
jgi:exodeoxyribonuclease-5